ncbi:SDR family NAD(P)-dependent oxidoreductase [Stenotrophobium rhamnosiphilum]|uniref:NAD-dependent oxidoreductase n=1 Tax=Stenotrophobium rhamnosiphilum TaxID=2029166 RepID=A0A2T5MCY2_9GAMM|nr:SDR family NAD(P)-dependent oxidoreductase [Stenotrophobium rhamnosiphilum]PTU30433.1 NAD-dependent oxidoreductase [Stenotrophobium rhamnosiphilum]
MELKGKVVVITGALGTLGKAVAEAAAYLGATVIAVDRVEGAKLAGVQVAPALDLGNSQATRDAFASLANKHGRIDALVNVAGGFSWETLADGSIETWDRLYQMNIRTAVNACQAALPHFPKSGGRIVNIGAAGAVKAAAGMGAYAASKSGIARLTEALAEELKAGDTTVNAVLPSIIDTPVNRADMPDADYSRWVTPQALADVIVFLLSDRARAITGALIPVTGRV